LSLGVGADERCLDALRVVHGCDLCRAFRTQCAAVLRIGFETLETDDATVDPASDDAAVLLADPARRVHEVLLELLSQ
jgi:hypothetical protein